MPIVYETAAPVAEYAALGAAQARREDQLRRLAQQQSFGGGGGGGGYGSFHGGGDDGIQSAINHRDDSQFRNQAQADSQNNVTQSQVFAANAASAQQRQSYQLQAQLQQTELSQQERMRLQRMQNAVGEVQNDPSLSDAEKSDMIVQLKTGIDPLQHRLASQKVAADEQLKQQQASDFEMKAALHKSQVEASAKTPDQRTGWVPDPKALAEISADLAKSMPGPYDPKALHEMAVQESIRQGLGHNILTHPDGKTEILSGAGSKADQLAAKQSGGDRSVLDEDKWLKIRGQVEANFDRKANETKDGDIPGTKVPAHPELQDFNKRAELVDAHLKKMGVPATLEELHAHMDARSTKGSRGYDPKKSQWYKPPATAANPTGGPLAAPDQKPFEWEKPTTPEQTAAVANFQGLDEKLKNSKAPAEMRQNAVADWGEAKMLLQKKGSVQNMDPDEKRRFLAALDNIAKTIQHDPAAVATPAPSQEKPWWAGGGQYGTPGKAISGGWRELKGAVQSASPFNR